VRLFIAIEFSDDIKRLLNRLRTDIPGARWVPMGQIHLTLAFLGEVDDITLKLLSERLTTIRSPGFQLRFSGTGCFPDRRRPRVLWVGLEPEPRLSELAERVRDAVTACNIPREERTFSPHITLARLKFPATREAFGFLDQSQQPEIPSVTVGEFILFQSQLTPQGAIHTPVRRFPLIHHDTP
jgi:2'-5' RNA ligase